MRCGGERLIQTLWFEGVGLLFAAPLYAAASGSSGGESLLVVGAVSVAMMLWAALYNSVFDEVEHRTTDRVASDRPHVLRVAHALGLEASSIIITTPLIWALSDFSWWGALVADLGLAAVYVAYGYVFHWAYDGLRPVRELRHTSRPR